MGEKICESHPVLNKRKKIQQSILALAAEHFPELEPRGRLPGYRYCFRGKVEESLTAIPVYLHLVIQHHRRKDEVLGHWEASYFGSPGVEKNRSPAVSATTGTIRLEDLGDHRWERFRKQLKAENIEGLLSSLDGHEELEIGLWQVYKNPNTRAKIPEQYEAVIRELVAQPGFSMSQPTRLNVANFIKGYVPEEARPEEGQFSLESSRARQKLADFQLTDPQSFVVHLISGAIAGGSDKVEVYVDSDDIIVEFGGRPLDRAALEQLFSNLLSGRSSPQGRELAVALNAASSLDPKLLLVESWREGQGVVLEIDEEGEHIREMEAPPKGEGHRVHFRDRPSLKVLKRFVNSLRRDHPELDLVRKRCSKAPVPILLEHKEDCRDFEAIKNSFFHLHWRHPEHPLLSFELSAPCKEEVSQVDASVLLSLGFEVGLDLMIHGVRYEPPESVDLRGLHALVCDNKASRDLSFTGLVADERWALLKQHLETGRDLLLREAARCYETLADEDKRRWDPTLRAKALRGALEFSSLRIFERLDGTLWDRATLLNHSAINFTGKEWKYGLRSGDPVYKLDRESQNLLWGGTFRCVDKELAAGQTYFSKKEAWMSRQPRVDFRFEEYEGPRHSLRGVEGEVALAQSPRAPSVIWTYARKRPLKHFVAKDMPPGVKVMANHDGLDVDDYWTELLANEALEEVSKVCEDGVLEFFDSLMTGETEHNDYLLNYLLYLKSKGENWTKYASRIKFQARYGEPVSLAEVLGHGSGKGGALENFWEESQRMLKTLAVPVSQLMMVRKLYD